MKKSITILTALLLISCGSNEKKRNNFILNSDIGQLTYRHILKSEVLKVKDTANVFDILKTTDSLYKIEIEKTAKKLYR